LVPISLGAAGSAGKKRPKLRKHTWQVAVLLFGSGFCALVYQIGWLREFRLIFGASTAAAAAVLAIFIGGLGTGGLLIGPRADTHQRPILLYSQLEAIVAMSAALSPLLLSLVRALYVAIGGTPRLGLFAGSAARLVLSALVLAIPTIAMGGTLPAAARGVTRQTDARRRDVAALYALNTLGAVAGCVVATFFFLDVFGTRATLWLAAAINLLVAVAARQVERVVEIREGGGHDSANRQSPQVMGEADGSGTWFVLVASAVVGFAFFLMELVWYRMLGPLLGGSVFTFGLILAVALAGIGIGGLAYALVSDDRPASLSGFATSCLLEAAAMAATFALGDRLALLTLVLRPLGQTGFGTEVAGWTLVVVLVVLPAAIAAGYQFPMLIALFGRGRERLGRQIGLAYAANTMGAIVGALAGGFGLLPWLSAPGAWRFASLTLVVLGVCATALSRARGVRRSVVPQLALVTVSLVWFTAAGPTAVWRHSGIGAGRAGLTITSSNQVRNWAQAQQRAVVWDDDGTESSVALSVKPDGYAFFVNGKSDGSARGDAGTQVMLGVLGAILNPQARRALVIGLGTGSTAGWLGAIPDMDRVDVVELEPLVVEVARACEAVNRDVLRNPKVHLTIGDARETLLTGHDRYDLIASEPSNPYRAGVASLFTREYYGAVSDRLTDGGLFLQWVQSYEIDARTLGTVYATIASVFPHVEAWEAGGADLVLVGAKQPPTRRADALATRIRSEPFKTALRVAWRTDDLTGLLAHFLANERLAATLAKAPGVEINTDDRNVVEFGFARSMGSDSFQLVGLRALARTQGQARPSFADQTPVDWAAVDTAWVAYQAGEQQFGGVAVAGPPGEQARQAALIHYYRDTDLTAARAAWQQQGRPPAGPNELAMLSDLEAETGSDAALAFIERLRMYQPGEAAAILATLRFRQARFEDAAAALEAAFDDFRTSPWAMNRYKERGLTVASAVAGQNDLMAARMFEALKFPFAVRALQDERLMMVASLTPRLNFSGLCRNAVAAFEPRVLWTRPFLTLRRDCYRAVGDPRLRVAAGELDEFLAHEPLSLDSGS
jgi:spermidine synthase